MTVSISFVKQLVQDNKVREALRIIRSLLEVIPDSPELLVLSGRLLLLQDESDPTPLRTSVEAYQEALTVDPTCLPALEELAHYYYSIEPNPALAMHYAQDYITQARETIRDLEGIIAESLGEPPSPK